MKTLLFILASLCGVNALFAQTTRTPTSAYNFILDYDVPESPAFVALGVTPQYVYSASSLKPVMVNLASSLLTGNKSGTGAAFDFSPYLTLFGGGIDNVREYTGWKAAVANFQVSLATLEPPGDLPITRFGFGARSVVFDDHDPLRDAELISAVSSALVGTTTLQRPHHDPNDEPVVTSGNSKSIADVYAAERDRISQKRGEALAVGVGLAGDYNYQQGEASLNIGRLWISFTEYRLLGGLDILSTVQTQTVSDSTTWTAGIAFRGTSDLIMADAEFAYASAIKNVQAGLNLEAKIMTGLRAVLGVEVTKRTEDTGRYTPRFTTSLKWSAGN